MIIIYDNSEKMSEDIIFIDKNTFGEITCTAQELSEKLSELSNYHTFVFYTGDTPCGYIALLHVCTLHYEAVWIDLMAVRPEFQGKGIAQKMVAESKDYCRAAYPNAEFMSALIRTSNLASLGAATKQGFSTDGKGSFELLFCDLQK